MQGHAFCQIGDARLTVRLMPGQFPDYERVIPSYSRTEPIRATVDRKQFITALQQVGRFADERSHSVRFSVNGSLRLDASGTEAGVSTASIPVEHEGIDLERIGFNYRYLVDGLKAFDDESATMLLTDEESCGMLRNASELAEWSYVVMPMRV